MYCGLIVVVKPTSMTMEKGYPSNSVWIDTVEVKYEGEVTRFDKTLCDYGVDERTDSGSGVSLTIEFSEDSSIRIPTDCEFPSIGWVQINPIPYQRPGEEVSNPIHLTMRLSLKKSDYQDFLCFGNNNIRIEPSFNWDKDDKFLTKKNGQVVKFDISRINIELNVVEE